MFEKLKSVLKNRKAVFGILLGVLAAAAAVTVFLLLKSPAADAPSAAKTPEKDTASRKSTVAVSSDPVPSDKPPVSSESVASPAPSSSARSFDSSSKPTVSSASAPTGSDGVKVGDIITFGHYEQDTNTANGAEAIEWQVLARENGRILVISKYALECRRFHDGAGPFTWETCSLRSWLNGAFFDTAFDGDEQARIPAVTVSADRNPAHGTDAGSATTDKVFLLSCDEVIRYLPANGSRLCRPTSFAVLHGAYVNNVTGGCWWLLRTPGADRNGAAGVKTTGELCADGSYSNPNDDAVRPAIWITLPA